MSSKSAVKSLAKSATKTLNKKGTSSAAAEGPEAFSLSNYLGSDEVKQFVQDMEVKVEGFVRKYPVEFIGGAIAAGLVAGMFFKDLPVLKNLSGVAMKRAKGLLKSEFTSARH